MKNKFMEVRRFYREIGRVWCPILDGDVNFNRSGFHHLLTRYGMRRPRSQQRKRVALLVYTKEIIENPEVKCSKEERIVDGMVTRFWGLVEKKDNLLIKVVVRQVGNGSKHFFSIYAKKQKSMP